MSNGFLYLSEWGNNPVVGYQSIPTTNGADADFVIGATDFTTSGNLPGAQSPVPYDGRLYVAEFVGNSIAVFNSLPTTDRLHADWHITGAASEINNGFSNPETISLAAGKLVLTDRNNNRVLIWNTLPTTDGTPPDLVLGQLDFTGKLANNGGISASTMNQPAGSWTDGQRLVIADSNNNRVLIWNSWPTANGQPADLVLGQSDSFSGSANNGGISASAMFRPYDGVYANEVQLFIADSNNHRVLIWNAWPTTNGQAADNVIGQFDFVSNTSGTTQNTLSSPAGVYLSGTSLIVTDPGNNRYMIYNGSH